MSIAYEVDSIEPTTFDVDAALRAQLDVMSADIDAQVERARYARELRVVVESHDDRR